MISDLLKKIRTSPGQAFTCISTTWQATLAESNFACITNYSGPFFFFPESYLDAKLKNLFVYPG